MSIYMYYTCMSVYMYYTCMYVPASLCMYVKYIDTFQNAVLNVWCSTCSDQVFQFTSTVSR